MLSIAMLSSISLANAATWDMMTTTTSTGVETTSSTWTLDDVFKIDKVDASIAKTIDITFTKAVSKDWADIKVMEDNRISSVTADTTDTKKVKISLNEDAKLDSSYNLFLVSGPEGSMNFTLWTELSTGSISNTDTSGDQNIESVSFLDSKNIEVTFKKDVAWDAEFKLLREVATDSVGVLDNKVTITTKEDLSTTKAYTLTIASLKDSEGNDIDSENSVYDFNYTGMDAVADTASGTDLNAASGATATGTDATASQAKELPGTGPKETLLFFAAMLIALLTVLYYRKKIAR